jgi:hypothetical protein
MVSTRDVRNSAVIITISERFGTPTVALFHNLLACPIQTVREPGAGVQICEATALHGTGSSTFASARTNASSLSHFALQSACGNTCVIAAF